MLGRKVIYVRCINCVYNNVAKGIRILDKKAFLFIQENVHASKSFEGYIPLINAWGTVRDYREIAPENETWKIKFI